MGGIINFGRPAENTVRITFDDQQTDEKRIVQGLQLGGVALPGKKTPATQGSPFVYQ